MRNMIDRLLSLAGAAWLESLALLFTRVVLAGIFWRSGRTKVEDGSLLTLSDTSFFLFQEEYAGVPLPPTLAAYLATWAEHLFPVLLVLGLATRLSALALAGMTLVIQIFVYPEAWWTVHALWLALALQLVTRGPGDLSLDRLLWRQQPGAGAA
jgi:putative oxidoreductase